MDPNLYYLRNEAIDSIKCALAKESTHSMMQVKLAVSPDVKWSKNYAELGKFQDFLRSCRNIFNVDESGGGGQYLVSLETNDDESTVELTTEFAQNHFEQEVPPVKDLRNEAITCIRRVLEREVEKSMYHAGLAAAVKWARNFSNLGKFQEFVRSCSEHFFVDDKYKDGKYVIYLKPFEPKTTVQVPTPPLNSKLGDESVNPLYALRKRAIECISAVLARLPSKGMLQVVLAGIPAVAWAKNFGDLGKFQEFLRTCGDVFRIVDEGKGSPMIYLNQSAISGGTASAYTFTSAPRVASASAPVPAFHKVVAAASSSAAAMIASKPTQIAQYEGQAYAPQPPPPQSMRAEAIAAIRLALENEPTKRMVQAKLAGPHVVKWSRNFSELGRFQDFLRTCSDQFHIEAVSLTENVVSLRNTTSFSNAALNGKENGNTNTHTWSQHVQSGNNKSYGEGFSVSNKMSQDSDRVSTATAPVTGTGTTTSYVPVRKEFTSARSPLEDQGLWRNFDRKDNFFYEGSLKLKAVSNKQSLLWTRRFDPAMPGSPLRELQNDVTLAQQLYDSAFCRSTRLTIAVKNVVNHGDVTRSVLENKFLSVLPDSNRSRLFVNIRHDITYMFLGVTVTVCGPDPGALEALTALYGAIQAGKLSMQKIEFGILHVGFKPVEEAVDVTVRDLMAIRRKLLHEQLRQRGEQPSPTFNNNNSTSNGNSFMSLAPMSTAISSIGPGPAAPLLPPTAKVWPDEYVMEDASKKIYDPAAQTELGEFIKCATADMAEKERLLRQRCEEMRLLPERERRRYGSGNNCEWIADPMFFLGKGSEATIYMGLYQDPSHPNRESVLVAVKQSHDDTNPFNSREEDHLMGLKRQPGIAQYHTSFTLEYGAMALFVLVQDIGLLSLRDVVSARGVNLTADQKFKLTKALCMAVKDLHTECSVVHRDLRPENVLLMRDGRMCITDFGLSRSTKMHGTLKYTEVKKTTMQPHEVQNEYSTGRGGMQAAVNVPIAHSGDVFMLGCVLAYIHQGRDPFTDDKIRARAPPDIDERIKTDQPWLYHLLTHMMHHDPLQRPSCSYVLKHPYFNGHNINFNACLFDNIEATLVRDNGPHDDENFKALEDLLRPIEQKMAALPEREKWYNKLPGDIFRDDLKLPFKAYPIKFVKFGAAEPRAEYPLPELAQLLKWIRNAVIHLRTFPHTQDKLRRTRGTLPGAYAASVAAAAAGGAVPSRAFYETAGEFFMTHPSVQWLLPQIWKTTFERVGQIERARVALVKENERRIEEYLRQCRAFEDQRTFAEGLLE